MTDDPARDPQPSEPSPPPIRRLLDLISAEVANPRRLQFPEILGWVLVVAFALMVVAIVVAAVLIANVSTGPGFTGQSGESISNVLVLATAWAEHPEVVLILLGSVGLAWWQIASWSKDLRSDDEPADLQDTRRHLIRASIMATAAGALLVITAMAAIGLAVGTWGNENGSDSVAWAFRLNYVGPSAATFFISVAGLFGVYLLRARVRRAYSNGDDAADVTEDLEIG